MYKLVFAPEFARDLDSTFEYISHVLCADKAAKELMKEICLLYTSPSPRD